MAKNSYFNNNNEGYEGSRYRCDHIIKKLEEKLYTRNQQDAHEEALREKNPALKDAWEQYQMLLKMSEE